MPQLSVSAAAKRAGVTRDAMYQRLRRMGITPTDGQIDADAVETEWERVRDDVQGGKNPSGKRMDSIAPAATHSKTPRKNSKAAIQLRRERAKYQLELIELRRAQEKVLDRAEVVRQGKAFVNDVRTRLLAMGTKLSPQLALETDESACQALITAEVHQALRTLMEWQPTQQ